MERPLSLNAVSKKYDEAFKRQAVEMVLRGGKTVKQAAEELGVSQYSIYEWKKKFLPLAALPGSKGKTSTSVGLVEDVEELQTLAACIYQKVLLRKRPRFRINHDATFSS